MPKCGAGTKGRGSRSAAGSQRWRGACRGSGRNHPQKGTPVSPKPKNQSTAAGDDKPVTRQQLIDGLNDDLSREYQAIIAYVVYSQSIKGAAYMNIAAELEKHAGEELAHAITIAAQIDYLGGDITVVPKPVKTSDDAKKMLEFDLQNESDTIRAYRERLKQSEALGEYAVSEHIRRILQQEQEHLTDLADALGQDPPDLSKAPAPR